VSRTPVQARTAAVSDVPVLVGLWRELRDVGGRAERAMTPTSVADIGERLRTAMASAHCRVVLAKVDGEPAGMAVLRVVRPDPLSDSRLVQISHVVVQPGKRRRGVGHALVAAAADFAEERGLEHVAAGIYPSLRDASRFYARLGFAPVLLQRVAPIGIVRRRLGTDTGSFRLDDVVRRRSRIRRPVPPQRAKTSSGQRVD
jgi:GNAT superfamily N-acetyltransferase